MADKYIPTIQQLDHVLFVRGGYSSMYTKRGIGQRDIILIAGLPEPIANFDETEFVQALIDDEVVVRCTVKGILPDGSRHSSIT